MEPFFFGPADRRLFGVYHPANAVRDRRIGVVLCAPMGQEQIRSHRAYLQIAMQLAEAGFQVLRFDLSGAGDSALDFGESGLPEWREDLGRALEELVEGTGVDRLCVVGVRLGASLALLCTAERRDVDTLVLWNPVISGPAYVDDIVAQHHEYFRGSFGVPNVPPGETESLGFPLSPALLSQLNALDLLALEGVSARQALLLDSEANGQPSPPIARLAEHLRSHGLRAECLAQEAPSVWRRHKDDEFGNVAVPTAVLEHLLDWLGAHAR